MGTWQGIIYSDAYLLSKPWIFPGAHWNSMGLTQISRVIWQVWWRHMSGMVHQTTGNSIVIATTLSTTNNKSKLKITGRLWVNSIFGFAYTVSKTRKKYLQVRWTSYFWALRSFQMLKGPLFQTKLHWLSNVLLSGFQSSRGALKFTE